VQLDTANPGSNKTKGKIMPGNSWLIINTLRTGVWYIRTSISA